MVHTDEIDVDFLLPQADLMVGRSVEDVVVVDVLLGELKHRLEREVDMLDGAFVVRQL